jgi:hypothetical protein
MSELYENAPAPNGWIAPTLDADWRFRVQLDFWIPNVIQVNIDSDVLPPVEVEEDLGWLLSHLVYYFPVNGQVRKGPFGAFFHTLSWKINGTNKHQVSPPNVEWANWGYLFDIGLSYELARWKLGDGPRAPEVTLEPYVAARLLDQNMQFLALFLSDVDKEFEADSTTPVIGLRTYWDLTDHWNLEITGDYGGFGVDNNHQTWQAIGRVGYRWPGWGAYWNVQAGYRAMRLLDTRGRDVDILEDVRGADLTVSVDF